MKLSRALAAAWSAGCSLLFLLVYGGCTWITAQRTDVGALYFSWELSLPFVPFLILPYWSLDLLFVVSFFFCRDRRELVSYGKRIVFAILASGACFLLFPLRCVHPRPPVEGLWGPLFVLLRSFDQPYNQFPALHVVLLSLVLDVYGRRTRGAARILLGVWFGLILLSTVLTYQHHVIDVAGGFALAGAAFYFFRSDRRPVPEGRNPRVAAWYAVGSLVALGLAVKLGPLGAGFAWPAASMAILAAGYIGLGASVYGKAGPRPGLGARILLAPCYLGQYVSWQYYRRRSAPWDEVVPGVWIGRRLSAGEAARAARSGVTAVLDLTAEFPEASPFARLAYRNLPVLDLTAPSVAQLGEAASFIGEHWERGVVYVHCKAGYSRSAAAVGAYLLRTAQARSSEEAFAILRRARPSIVLRPEAMGALREFERRERNS